MNDEQREKIESHYKGTRMYIGLAIKGLKEANQFEMALGYQKTLQMIEYSHELVMEFLDKMDK